MVNGAPSVSTREIDLSAPQELLPVGTPAGVIGTSVSGPAFVPITVATFNEFIKKFGNSDGEKFGPLAVREWLRNAQACTFVRVLGAGDGKKRTTSGNDQGKVNNAGFVVGQEIVQSNGLEGQNSFANAGGLPGRVHFLGCVMSESAGSSIFSDAGIQSPGSNTGVSILRGVVLAASGVVPMLSGNNTVNSSAPTSTLVSTAEGPRGSITGTVNLSSGKKEFVMLLNGHKGADAQYPNVLTASFDIDAPNYFANVFNTDPFKVEEAGYVLYSHYDIANAQAVLTGSGIYTATASFGAANQEDIAFLTTGSNARNVGTSTVPNYENFEDRFATARAPYVVSQKFGGKNKNLFQIHARSDGQAPNSQFKISIQNIAKSNNDIDKYGSFDVIVRAFDDTDDDPVVLEQFRGLSLNPSSERYIARIIGDQNAFFDFDQNESAQKLVIEGNHPNKSNLIRVEMALAVENAEMPEEALPVGFRGGFHTVTSGSVFMTTIGDQVSADVFETNQEEFLKRIIEPPVPFRENITVGTNPKKQVRTNFHWGVQFEHKTDLDEPNKSFRKNKTIANFAKYLPNFQTNNRNFSVGENVGTANANGSILDADLFNNNLFSLENIRVRTGSNDVADSREWVSASYVRNGNISPNAGDKTRALNVEKDFGDPAVKKLNKFSFFLQGGFDGTNIFNKEKTKLTNVAARRELDDSAQGQADGATVASYKKAIDVLSNRSDVIVKVFAVPGIRVANVTDKGLDEAPDMDALFVMDVEERDTLNFVVTSSITQQVHVDNTITDFKNRALNEDFGAAYFPDLIMTDEGTNTNLRVPPSIGVLSALSLNDAVAFPWFAPAGFTRGALGSVQETAVRLNEANLDALYDGDINPITSFPDSNGPVVWGQKTLKAISSALDRVNVRRLLIELRREIREVSRTIIFEPLREETLNRFSNLLRPRFRRVQEQQGLDRFKIEIDTSTTTQADVLNNTIRGKISIIPTRSIEFINLDFVISNAGVAFS